MWTISTTGSSSSSVGLRTVTKKSEKIEGERRWSETESVTQLESEEKIDWIMDVVRCLWSENCFNYWSLYVICLRKREWGGKVKIYWKCQASGDCSRLESWEKKQKREIEKVRELQETTRKQKSTWNMNKCVNEYNIKHSKAPLALTWNLLKQGCSGCFDFGEQQIEYVARWLNWRGVEDEKVRWNVCRTPAQADIDSC